MVVSFCLCGWCSIGSLFWYTETPPIGIKVGQVWWDKYNDWDDPFIKKQDTVFFEIMEIRECTGFWGHDYVDGNMSWSGYNKMKHRSMKGKYLNFYHLLKPSAQTP